MNAYFCDKTGVRIVPPLADWPAGKPRVCKAVDPELGVDEFSEQPAADAKTAKKPAETNDSKPAADAKTGEKAK